MQLCADTLLIYVQVHEFLHVYVFFITTKLDISKTYKIIKTELKMVGNKLFISLKLTLYIYYVCLV